MRWKLLGCLWLTVSVLGGSALVARAGEPVVGASVGAAIPISDFQHSARVGGSVAASGGYHLDITGGLALSLLVEPQLAEFPVADCQPQGTAACGSDRGNAVGMFSLTAGPRLSLIDGPMDLFLGFQGGYYTYTNGFLTGNAGGENVRGGLNYEFRRGTSLGFFLRWDHSGLEAEPVSNKVAVFLQTGLSFEHRFLPPPPVVAQAPPPPAPAPPPPLKKKVVLRGVNFDFAKAVIRPDARPVLDQAIATLKQDGDITIAVEGYTDNIGTEAYNQKLSERRARAVADYLIAGGIAPDRMSVKGFGESDPVASNDTAQGRAENRRVELRVVSGP